MLTGSAYIKFWVIFFLSPNLRAVCWFEKLGQYFFWKYSIPQHANSLSTTLIWIPQLVIIVTFLTHPANAKVCMVAHHRRFATVLSSFVQAKRGSMEPVLPNIWLPGPKPRRTSSWLPIPDHLCSVARIVGLRGSRRLLIAVADGTVSESRLQLRRSLETLSSIYFLVWYRSTFLTVFCSVTSKWLPLSLAVIGEPLCKLGVCFATLSEHELQTFREAKRLLEYLWCNWEYITCFTAQSM